MKDTKLDTLITLGGKTLILLLNFVIVVITTRLWGAEGRGIISLFVADLGLVGIFASVFNGSSVSYYVQRVSASRLVSQGVLWATTVAGIGAIIEFVFRGVWQGFLFFAIACLAATISFHSALYIGKQKIKAYNLVTILQPALTLVFTLLLYFLVPQISFNAYFIGYLLSVLFTLVVASWITQRKVVALSWEFDRQTCKNSLQFGWKTELSNIIQFLNYRFTYYVLGFYLGNVSVGIFSIGVTISEAIWIFSRSVSLVQYSQVLKEGDTLLARKMTRKAAWLSAAGSLVCIIGALLLPTQLYVFVFGAEFADVKTILWLLSPGVLAIAISNVYGNFFSATKHLNILVIKSLAGLVATILLSVILVPIWGIKGACVVNSISYIVSSLILFLVYCSKAQRGKSREEVAFE